MEKHPRFKLHFTPTRASWLNTEEGWFSQLERRALYRGVFTTVTDLKVAIRQFITVHNDQETLATGFLALAGVLEIGKAHLPHGMAGLQKAVGRTAISAQVRWPVLT